jgi:hypothetical protein
VVRMKKIFAIATAFLMVPLTAFPMTLMRDHEMDSITGQAGESTALVQLDNIDRAAGNIDPISEDSLTSMPVAAESNRDRESENILNGMSVSHGVSIFVYDVCFDIHIFNIAFGDLDGCCHSAPAVN